MNRVGAQRLTAAQLFSEQLDGKILREVWRLQTWMLSGDVANFVMGS